MVLDEQWGNNSMADVTSLRHCRVCGLAQPDFPWGEDGKSPTFMLCSCCGVEFGYTDATWRQVRQWRDDWIAAGARWREPGLKPPGWSLEEQIGHIPMEFR